MNHLGFNPSKPLAYCAEKTTEWQEIMCLTQKLKRKAKLGTYTVDEEVDEAMGSLKNITHDLAVLAEKTQIIDEQFRSQLDRSKSIALLMANLVDPHNSFSPQVRKALKESLSEDIFSTEEEKLIFSQEYSYWETATTYKAVMDNISTSVEGCDVKAILDIIKTYAKKGKDIIIQIKKNALHRQKALDDFDLVYNTLDGLIIKSETRELSGHEAQIRYALERKVESKKANYEAINESYKKELPYILNLFQFYYEPLIQLLFFSQLLMYYQAYMHAEVMQDIIGFDPKSPKFFDGFAEYSKRIEQASEDLNQLSILNFRDNFYQELIPQGPRKDAKYYKAVYRFSAQQKGDLSLEEGDIIEVTNKSGNWWYGKTETGSGLIPSNYVEPLM